MGINNYAPPIYPVKWYLRRPRTLKLTLFGHDEGINDFTYERCFAPSLNKRTPKALRHAWVVKYKGEEVIQLYTIDEVKEFIKDKLDN